MIDDLQKIKKSVGCCETFKGCINVLEEEFPGRSSMALIVKVGSEFVNSPGTNEVNKELETYFGSDDDDIIEEEGNCELGTIQDKEKFTFDGRFSYSY